MKRRFNGPLPEGGTSKAGAQQIHGVAFGGAQHQLGRPRRHGDGGVNPSIMRG